MTIGLIMAGGRGSRMRSSGIDVSKPLVRVAGIPLLEWNVRSFVTAGLDQIVVSISIDDEEVKAFTAGRCSEIVSLAGARLSLLEEQVGLGNVGCARELLPLGETVLLTFADNLTTLDLNGLLEHHDQSGADLTLAAHHEPCRVPFGVLEIEGDSVVGYREKPDLPVLVSSGTSVLSPEALATIPPAQPSGLSDLFGSVRASGGRVEAFLHHASWVDVNDADAILRAEQIVQAHPAAFHL